MAEEEQSSPFVIQPKSAGLRGSQTGARLKKVVGGAGTGGGFSQIGNEDESGMADSEAKEFLVLEQLSANNVTPRGEIDNVSKVSSSSMRYSALRSSVPS